MSLEDRIIAMEQRVLNARTVEAARNFHDQLDRLYEARGDKISRSRMSARPGKHGPAKTVSADYERGYQAGYHAGQRMTEPETCAICNNSDKRDLGTSLAHWRDAPAAGAVWPLVTEAGDHATRRAS